MVGLRGRVGAGLWGAGGVRGLLTRHSDLALAALVVSIVAMMIVPLPALLLDLLISLNIAGAVTLLLISIYVTDALRIAAFPTLLLLTTLFRLALEVSATRLILSNASAGDVIHAFGAFVVAGNLVVGAVIFLILTVIQFIVISKGAERVAEVAARFTLDALPGKQMAIDAELRAGYIDRDEASRRRALLARESQLFGAMDGAMKFVKGDAVAGLVVMAVNIGGGLIIGTLQRDLDLPAAARTYTLLTIGGGLVAQIPALIMSTAAGIIVTRVATEDEGSHLGREIAAQVLAHPRALAIAAGLMLVLAGIPGLPAFPFLLLATILAFVAYGLVRSPPVSARPAPSRAATAPPLLAPIEVRLGAALWMRLCPAGDGDGDAMARRLENALGPRLFDERGIPLPVLRVLPAAGDAAPAAFIIRFDEVPVAEGDLDGADATGSEVTIADHLWTLLRRHAHLFVDIETTQSLLDSLARSHPALVREVVPKVVSPALLADVLRRLAREEISLRHLKDILGALAGRTGPERDAAALTEHVRAALRRAITLRHAHPDGVLRAYTLDPMIEEAVRAALHKTERGTALALEPDLSRDIVQAVGRAIAHASSNGGPAPVILTSADLRRHVRRLVEPRHPHVAVLAFPELAPDATVQPLGAIRA